jgi:lipopolysaccharide export system protein LptA
VKVVSHDNENQALVVKSESMEWNAQGKDIQAKDHVVVTYRGSTATAESMDYSQTTQVAVLSSPGKNAALPKIEQEGDVITGKTLILKTKERIYEARGSARAEVWPKEKSNRAVPGRTKEKP